MTVPCGRSQSCRARLLVDRVLRDDDELPFDYIGARLGTDPADVPRPATQVEGIKSLEYFARLTGRRAKAKMVGSWPCAVFGKVAADEVILRDLPFLKLWHSRIVDHCLHVPDGFEQYDPFG